MNMKPPFMKTILTKLELSQTNRTLGNFAQELLIIQMKTITSVYDYMI